MNNLNNFISEETPPKASAMINTFRAFGYNLQTAIADIIDNSISANAENIWVNYEWKGSDSWVSIIDDGIGRQQSKALKTAHQQKQNSKGMGNIKKRVRILNAMYKDKVTVFIEDYQQTEASGTKVVVTLKK